ncbi:MAG: PqqD family peptide modification chaperone [Clostridiales bacterium]|nr:PqqD family peptide modification chaperone [Clostridiales bacterium]
MRGAEVEDDTLKSMKNLFTVISNGYTRKENSEKGLNCTKTDVAVVCLPEVSIWRTENNQWIFRLADGAIHPCVIANSDYDSIALYTESDSQSDAATRFLLRTAFECRFCHEGIVSLHAACVEKDGQAVAFTGESGLGKSTRARAWVENLGAEWISGDRPAVRLEKEGSTACGVPWDGKEQIFRNVERPLKAILEVRRSESNYIRRLTKDQARQLLMQQTFVPMWDTESAILAMANVRKLIDKTPVYRVFCGPDGDSAREIYDILFHHPEKIREEKEQMKVKDGFVLRNVVDEYIVMPTGDNIAKFEGAVVLNEVSAFVFEKLQHPMSKEDLLQAILDEFDVDEETAKNDLDALVEKLSDMGLIDA